MRNQRAKESTEAGVSAEQKFYNLCKVIGYECIRSNDKDNIHNHIDFIVKRNEEYIGVDVKGLNTAECIWVELRNVNGKPGWLYGGADYIAFDMVDMKGFAIVNRLDLYNQVIAKTKAEFVTKDKALHKLYTREGRHDIITQMLWNDVFYLNSFKFYNYATYSTDFNSPRPN